MLESVSSQCRLLTDESIIYREISTVNDCTSLQDDLDVLEKWEGTWGMSFDPSKCNIIHVSRQKKPCFTLTISKAQTLRLLTLPPTSALKFQKS